MGRSNKGSRYEREICTELSLWWSGGKRDDIFWRSSTSGARATSRAKKGKSTGGHDGDVCAIHPSGELFCDLFSIEIKRGYPKETIFDLVDRPEHTKQKKFEAWMQQAMEAHANAGSFSWLLIVKRDQREAIVFMPVSAYVQLCLACPTLIHSIQVVTPIKLQVPHPTKKKKFQTVTTDPQSILGVPFHKFLKVDPKALRTLARRL